MLVSQQPAHSAVTETTQAATTSALQRSCSLSTFSSIPSITWKDHWTQPGPYAGLFSVETITYDMCAGAINGILVEDLNVCVLSMSDLINTYKTMLGDVIKDGNFTHTLS